MTTTATRRVNLTLLRDALDRIEAEPQHWNQHAWAARTTCGTTYCLAGWTCVLAGHHIDWDNAIYADDAEDAPMEAITLTNGWLISAAAQRLLGLTDAEADRLFDGHNTLPELHRMAAQLAEAAA